MFRLQRQPHKTLFTLDSPTNKVREKLRDFTEGNISKQLILFSLPMVVGNLFQQAYSLIDAMVLGQFVGGYALAAIGVSMGVLFFITSVLIGLTTGASILLSQFYGAKQYDRLQDTVSVSFIFLAGLSVIIVALGIILTPQLLHLLNTDSSFFAEAQTYLRIVMAGMVFQVFFNMYTAYLRALGDAKGPLYILIITSILNIALTLLFVVTFRLGVQGAAISTVISQMVAMILCYLYARRRTPLLRIKKLLFDFELFKMILKYGIPAALQLSFVSLASLAITRLVNSFGASAMAGITAVSRIDALATMPITNFSMALSTFVAQNMGAGLEDRARKGLRIAIMYMLLFSVCMSILLMVLGYPIISMFLDQGDINAPMILDIGQRYLNIMVIFYFTFAFLFAFNGFFRGVGAAVMAMALPIISLSIRTIAAYALAEFAGMEVEAVAWSIPIGWGISSLIGFVFYKKRLWTGKVAVKASNSE
jgi:putative MATE family efflux protein